LHDNSGAQVGDGRTRDEAAQPLPLLPLVTGGSETGVQRLGGGLRHPHAGLHQYSAKQELPGHARA